MTDSSSSSNDGLTEPVKYHAGSVIGGKYRLIRPLGAGGTATIWVAHNQVLDVEVAIKLMKLASEAAPTLSERLLTEARTAARLGHPAIVRVFDFGLTSAGDPFVVMELLQGESLGELLARESRLSAIRGVQLLLPIADGLASAHAKGIVHRDVKPENIVLARDEAERLQPKLLDFGIARFGEAKSRITLAGAVLGTPDYMSPEQARGEDVVDHRTDVWSFCVVLYEVLTGRTPFDAPNYNALLNSIIHDDPAPITDHAAGDQNLSRILERGLRRTPEDRWESMRVLGEALALWLYEHGEREDVCAASLKTAWLDAGLGGVKIEVLADPPASDNEERTPPAGVRPEGRELSTSEEGGASDQRKRRPGIRAVVGLGLLAVLVLAIVALQAFGARTDPALAAQPSSAEVLPGSTPAAAPPEPLGPTARIEQPPPPEPSALHSAGDAPEARRGSVPARAQNSTRSPKTRPRPTPARAKEAAPASSSRQKEYDFGF